MTDTRCQKALSPESSCHTGETVGLGNSHLSWSRSQPLTAIQAKQLGSTQSPTERLWHNNIKANNNQWLGFISLETPQRFGFSKPVLPQIEQLLESHLLHPKLTRSTLHQSCFTLQRKPLLSLLTDSQQAVPQPEPG